MATKAEKQTQTAQQTEQADLLEQAIGATKNTTRDHATELLHALTEQALKGTVTWDKNLTKTIQNAVTKIDEAISKQLNSVLHNEKFLKLEGSWRGLYYFVQNSLTGSDLKIKLLNTPKKELLKNFNKSLDFDQSELFKKLYEHEYGTPGGEPYGLLIGDYEFGNNPEDLELLDNISHVAAGAFCPFISAAAPSLMGLDNWTQLSKPTDLEKLFQTPEFAKWNGLRNSEDARFVSLAMPRVLAREPYGKNTRPAEGFEYEETELARDGKSKPMDHDQYCWMNAAYVMGARMTDSFAQNGWCTAIRGMENGGKVEGLPTHVFKTDSGDLDAKCPTEIAISDRREAELSKLGFLPLCHYKNTDYAVFFSGQTIQKPKQFSDPNATANAEISARLPCIMATSRFAHYLKVMARDKIGSFSTQSDLQSWLNEWIRSYVNTNPDVPDWVKAQYPLAEAKVTVEEIAGKPGSFNAVAYLRPWLQLEELNTSLRLVARIPEKN